jgi:hypothetical protein
VLSPPPAATARGSPVPWSSTIAGFGEAVVLIATNALKVASSAGEKVMWDGKLPWGRNQIIALAGRGR